MYYEMTLLKIRNLIIYIYLFRPFLPWEGVCVSSFSLFYVYDRIHMACLQCFVCTSSITQSTPDIYLIAARAVCFNCCYGLRIKPFFLLNDIISSKW